MKRTSGIHSFISLVLGMAVGVFLMQAIQNSNVIYGVFTIMATIACVLNVACGHDESNNKE